MNFQEGLHRYYWRINKRYNLIFSEIVLISISSMILFSSFSFIFNIHGSYLHRLYVILALRVRNIRWDYPIRDYFRWFWDIALLFSCWCCFKLKFILVDGQCLSNEYLLKLFGTMQTLHMMWYPLLIEIVKFYYLLDFTISGFYFFLNFVLSFFFKKKSMLLEMIVLLYYGSDSCVECTTRQIQFVAIV